MRRLCGIILFVAIAGECAHAPALVSCVDQLTPEQEQKASDALARDDYESALVHALAGAAPCLLEAAVEAAIDEASHRKLAGRADPAVATAVELHGQAWLDKHRRR